VKADRVRGRNHRTGDDVIAQHQGPGNGLADAVDVDGGSRDEGNQKTNGGGQEARNHQNAKPTHINAVVGASDPLAQGFPGAKPIAIANCSGHGGYELQKDRPVKSGIQRPKLN
jgi:hypothetical protein